MNKKILHISHTDISSDSRILKELNALSNLENTILAGIGYELNEGTANTRKQRPFTLTTLKLLTRRLSFLPKAIRYAFNIIELTLQLSVRGIRFRPDIIHCHDTMVLLAGLIIKITTGCKLIYDAHELESDKNGQSRFLSSFTLIIEKLCWRHIDLLISVSNSINQWYETNLGKKFNIVVLNSPEIPDVIDVSDNNKFDQKYFHRKFSIDRGRKIFVYLGILSKGRGIEGSLAAFSEQGCKADIVFIGYGPLQNEISAHSIKSRNIHLHEPVAHEDVVPLVKHADFGLCLIENISLSDYYCLPNKLFEYAFSGLPVLASDFPEISRIVEKYNLGFCTDGSMSQLAKKIEMMVAKPSWYIEADLSDLSWHAQSVKILETYRLLLQRT